MPYVPGDNWIICDISGRKVLQSQSRKTWDGLRCHPDYYDPKHPQLSVKAKADKARVVDGRPRQADVFIDPDPQYLYRDDFTTDLAAESVDGSATEPGPGTRYLRDESDDPATNVSYINSGRLGLHTQEDGYIAIYRIMPELDKVVGRTLIAKIRLNSFNMGFYIEWFCDDPTYPGLYFVSGVIVNSMSGAYIGAYEVNTDYYVAIQMQAVGTKSYIKGGHWTDWTHVYSDTSTDPYTPARPATWYSGDRDAIAYVYFMRVPLDPITDISELGDYIHT